MEYSIKHLDSDTFKTINFTKDYVVEFESDKEAFLFLAKTNEQQSFCYGQKDFFNDVEIQKNYEKWRSNLNISEYKRLTECKRNPPITG